jgi:hypothetical protein
MSYWIQLYLAMMQDLILWGMPYDVSSIFTKSPRSYISKTYGPDCSSVSNLVPKSRLWSVSF